MTKCFFCQTELEFKNRQPGRAEECPKCGGDLHCCFQCIFYDEVYNNKCRETQAPRTPIKDRSNFCDWFEFGREDEERLHQKGDIKSKLDTLFKKQSS